MLGDLLVIERINLAQVLVQDVSLREELRAVFVREFAVGQVIPHPAADGGPIQVERRNRQHIGQVHLVHEFLGGVEEAFEHGNRIGVDGRLAGRVNRRRHAADQVGLQVRVFGTKQGVRADDIPLPVQGFQVMRDRHQVGRRRKFVGWVSPIGIGERTELSASNKGGEFILDALEVVRARFGPIRNGLGQFRGRGRIGVQRADHIHPVQRMQVIEVDHVVLDELNPFDNVAQDAGVVWNGDFQRVFHGAHGGERVDGGADTAGALRDGPGIARVASFQDDLDAAEHRAGRPGILHGAFIHLDFDPQVAFDTADGVNSDSCHS